MTNEELEQQIALWKRATGYDDPEDLDSFLGRAGVLNQFDVLNRMLADANKEKVELRALLSEALGELAQHIFTQDSPACINCGGESGFDVGRACPYAADYELRQRIAKVLNK